MPANQTIKRLEDLNGLSKDDLFKAAATIDHAPEVRYEALCRWLYPKEPNVNSSARYRELLTLRKPLVDDNPQPASSVGSAANNKSFTGPYFDRQGRLLVKYEGNNYLIDASGSAVTQHKLQKLEADSASDTFDAADRIDKPDVDTSYLDDTQPSKTVRA
jgi:hypothetical protein